MNQKPIRIGLFGAGGRMGKEILNIIQEDKFTVAAVGISKTNEVAGYLESAQKLNNSFSNSVDVWIDFSLPKGLEEILKFCVETKKPLVSGTTGLNPELKNKLKLASQEIPILWSSNMSLGIIALKKAIESFSILNDFDFQIEEIHHRQKKDSPSGTAISLQEKLKEVTQIKNLPNPLSIRGGGVFGVHKIFAMSAEEVLTYEHQALNRKVFARGALWAAQKIINKPNGLYGLEDLVLWP